MRFAVIYYNTDYDSHNMDAQTIGDGEVVEAEDEDEARMKADVYCVELNDLRVYRVADDAELGYCSDAPEGYVQKEEREAFCKKIKKITDDCTDFLTFAVPRQEDKLIKDKNRPFDQGLKNARDKTHKVFDYLWRIYNNQRHEPAMSRKSAYSWLQKKMGLTEETCHFSLFTKEQCRVANDLVHEYLRKRKYKFTPRTNLDKISRK